MSEIARAWCRIRCRGQFLRPSHIGGGSLRCVRCGAGFVDVHDGGGLLLNDHERALSPAAEAFVHREEASRPTPQLEGGSYRVIQGGREKRGRIA